MSTFLGETARQLYSIFGDGLSNVKIVFPGQRAARFFSNELLSVVKSPIWEPEYITIDQLMSQLTGLSMCNHIVAVSRLYEIYVAVLNSNNSSLTIEPFDRFYGWGEKMLANFDSVDKYMVDARMLFTNISDLKEIEFDNSYLDERQREIIKRFFLGVDISGKQSTEKSRFVSIWNLLYEIYTKYRESLQSQGLAYSGMIYRATAEAIKRGEIELSGDYAVVGFNALSTSEKVLFESLKAHGAYFFWDYDDYYVNNQVQEAGLFLRENIRNYPSQFDFGHDNFRKEKRLRVISAPTDALQCKYVNRFLTELRDAGELTDRRTAIVLTDESLLLPVLHTLPEDLGSVNVTMGYPLRSSIEYSLVERLIRLQNHCRGQRFFVRDVKAILTHPLVVECLGTQAGTLLKELNKSHRIMLDVNHLGDETVLLGKIFRKCDDIDSITEYVINILCLIFEQEGLTVFDREILGHIVDNVYRLRNSLSGLESKFDVRLYTSLMLSMLKGVTVPFKSESVAGIQIMGILETRNLDFDNILILSMNDDSFPGNLSDWTSFIPCSLREGYGLPTPHHHEGVFAYYFYRLLQRASNVDMVYCTKSDEKRTGEHSRYISQLSYEDSWHKISRINLMLNVSLSETDVLPVEKTDEMIARLRDMRYSPSSLESYMSCPYRFYLRYIKGLSAKKVNDENDIDSQEFGLLVHDAMRILYTPISTLPFDSQQEAIRALINSSQVVEAVNSSFRERFLGGNDGHLEDELGGEILVVRDIVVSYINKNILPYDSERKSFGVVGIEQPINGQLSFPEVGDIQFYGIVDRMDNLWDGRLRIVDYKTGDRTMAFKTLQDVFSGDYKAGAAFQVLLYSILLKRNRNNVQVQPELYQILKMNSEEFTPHLTIGKEPVHYVTDQLESEFIENLSTIIFKPLFDRQQMFVQTEDSKKCENCDFNTICNR